MAGAGHGGERGRFGGLRLHGHLLLPVRPVSIFEEKRERGAEGAAEAKPGEDSDPVSLDLHPAAAAVTGLTPAELLVYRLHGDRQARGQTLQEDDEGRTVGFAGGEKTQHGGLDMNGAAPEGAAPEYYKNGALATRAGVGVNRRRASKDRG